MCQLKGRDIRDVRDHVPMESPFFSLMGMDNSTLSAGME